MSEKNIKAQLLSVISAILLLGVLLLTVIQVSIFDLTFFQAEYQKLDTAKTIGMSQEELMETTEGLLAYIRGERADLIMGARIKGQVRQVFNEKEIRHMVDVQQLYLNAAGARTRGLVLLVFVYALLLALTGSRFPKIWAAGYLRGMIFLGMLLGLMGLAISRDFTWFWDQFHLVFFSNDLWILDPNTDIMIQMVPEPFFFDLVTKILVTFGASTGILAVMAGFIGWFTRKEVHK